MALLPEDAPDRHLPVSIVGDGNCFPANSELAGIWKRRLPCGDERKDHHGNCSQHRSEPVPRLLAPRLRQKMMLASLQRYADTLLMTHCSRQKEPWSWSKNCSDPESWGSTVACGKCMLLPMYPNPQHLSRQRTKRHATFDEENNSPQRASARNQSWT